MCQLMLLVDVATELKESPDSVGDNLVRCLQWHVLGPLARTNIVNQISYFLRFLGLG